MSAPLIITPDVTAALDRLVAKARAAPVDMASLAETLQTVEGREFHRRRMTDQTVVISGPRPFHVTFSIETGHPAGLCRHMSVSVESHGRNRVPNTYAIEMVAECMGFTGSMRDWLCWPETLSDGSIAVNVLQPMGMETCD